MTIKSVDHETGVFSGSYTSAVGRVKGPYLLTGCLDTAGSTVGWIVNWQNEKMNAHSVTAWSGQLQTTSMGEPIILTTWLLTSQTSPEKNWESTQVGFDHFSLKPLQQETKDPVHLRTCNSHPSDA